MTNVTVKNGNVTIVSVIFDLVNVIFYFLVLPRDIYHVNKTDMERLEIKYRGELKRMLALPSHTPSPIIYLVIGILPATARRDLDILGLLGQVAMCAEDQQYVTDITKNNLEDYDTSFGGWSSLARKTAEK